MGGIPGNVPHVYITIVSWPQDYDFENLTKISIQLYAFDEKKIPQLISLSKICIEPAKDQYQYCVQYLRIFRK